MRPFRLLQRYSRFSDKLKKIQQDKQEIPPIQNDAPKSTTDSTSQTLPQDLNHIIKNTGTSYIYKYQPAIDTINLLDQNNGDYSQSRKGEKLRFKISGEESQIAVVDIYPGERVRSESDKILFMTEGVNMETHTGGGAGSMFSRFLGGSSLFVTDYTYDETEGFGRVAFAETFPSKILPIRLSDYGGSITCKKGTYICGTSNVDINITFSKKFTTGFFGGEGFILQSLSQNQPGQTVLLRAGGSLIKRTLRVGEKLKVAPGMVVAFQSTIQYDIEMINLRKNLLNMFGGSRSLFQATFTGPGDLFLQSLSFENLVEEIASRIPSGGGGSLFSIGGRGGGDNDDKDDEEDA